MPILDLTEIVQIQSSKSGLFQEKSVNDVSRALYRDDPYVLLIGPEGVGKRTLVRAVAETALRGQLPHLKDKRFLEIDCRLVSRNDGRPFLDALGGATSQNERSVWVLDGVGNVLRDDEGKFLHASLLSLLNRSRCGLILTMTHGEYLELLANYAHLPHRFTKIEIDVPDDQQTQVICNHHAARLSEQFS